MFLLFLIPSPSAYLENNNYKKNKKQKQTKKKPKNPKQIRKQPSILLSDENNLDKKGQIVDSECRLINA